LSHAVTRHGVESVDSHSPARFFFDVDEITVNEQTALPSLVKRSSGSLARFPITVTFALIVSIPFYWDSFSLFFARLSRAFMASGVVE
jgi:hypothetical protein